jgi:D-glycero-alpha-D-manno-heptose-7-phosphate kinase
VNGFEVIHYADLPAGTGLGSSSTFTVGMLHTFYSLLNYMPTKRELALEAINIEQEVFGESVGSQDQIAAAFGGFNKITFGGTNKFDVDPIIITPERLKELQRKLLLCFTGFSRSASDIAQLQILETPSKVRELRIMEELTKEAFDVLRSPFRDLNDFGKLLDENWKVKRSLTPQISSSAIEEIYRTALNSGAMGGKILGAGGGGFMLLFADESKHQSIRNALANIEFVSFRFEETGSKIVYFSHE